MKFPNYKNNFSFLPKNALYRADNITANHFFTTRNSDTDILPFEIIQAEKQIHSADIIYINDDNINKPHYCDGFVISESSFLNADSSYGIAVRTVFRLFFMILTTKSRPLFMPDGAEQLQNQINVHQTEFRELLQMQSA